MGFYDMVNLYKACRTPPMVRVWVRALAGKPTVAYILVNVEVGMENEVLDEILKRFDKAVTEARITYGEYDIVVRVEVGSIKALETVVSGIRSIEGVRRTVTLIAV